MMINTNYNRFNFLIDNCLNQLCRHNQLINANMRDVKICISKVIIYC